MMLRLSLDETLFLWIRCHWSITSSSGVTGATWTSAAVSVTAYLLGAGPHSSQSHVIERTGVNRGGTTNTSVTLAVSARLFDSTVLQKQTVWTQLGMLISGRILKQIVCCLMMMILLIWSEFTHSLTYNWKWILIALYSCDLFHFNHNPVALNDIKKIISIHFGISL